MGRIHKGESRIQCDYILSSLQKSSDPNGTKALRKKGFPLFDEIAELVGGTRATGENAFWAGQPTPAPTQNATESASTSYEPVIDPELLDISIEGGRATDEEMDRVNPPVVSVHRFVYLYH